jgi:cytochrome b
MSTTTNQELTIKVWDLPVRVFHWMLALSFTGAYLTSESEAWRLVHVSLGYTLGGLIAFRLLWGMVGTRYARFGSFVRGPATILKYVRSLISGKPEHFVGHNPAGAVAIVLMLVLGLVQLATGWATYNEVGGEWLAELHEGAANTMLVVIFIHLVGVVSASVQHHENLARAMVTGRKIGAPNEAIRNSWRVLGVGLALAVVGFWVYQWNGA